MSPLTGATHAMMQKCWNTALILTLVTATAAGAAAQRAAQIPVDTAAMDAHLRFLASDLLEGRAPATRGGRLAAEYIAAQFQALGLEPAGANGTYFQPVALVGMTPEPTLSWGKAGGAADTLAYREAVVAWGDRPEAEIAASGDVVFVGYGIRAPEWQWDDYKGADLHGKVLLMLVNDPGLVDSTVFLGKILTYYGRWTYKLEEAARRGAAGAILIHTTESATYPWEVVRGSWSVEQFKLDQPHSPSIAFSGWVTEAAARPRVPLGQTAAVLNLGVTNVRGATRDIGALGMDRSTLGPVFEAAARAESLTVESQPDVRGSFFRSDHFPFARSGVPALSIKPGVDFVGRPKGWGVEQENVYNQDRYHQPSDEYKPTFRFDGMAQQVRVTGRAARAIANSPSMPQWRPSSEFQRPVP